MVLEWCVCIRAMLRQLIIFFFVVRWLENYNCLSFPFLGLHGLFQIWWLVCLLVGMGDIVYRGSMIWKVVASVCLWRGMECSYFLKWRKFWQVWNCSKLFVFLLIPLNFRSSFQNSVFFFFFFFSSFTIPCVFSVHFCSHLWLINKLLLY